MGNFSGFTEPEQRQIFQGWYSRNLSNIVQNRMLKKLEVKRISLKEGQRFLTESFYFQIGTQLNFNWSKLELTLFSNVTRRRTPHLILIYRIALQVYSLGRVTVWVSGRCLEGVWKVSGRCLEGVWKVSGRCLEGVLKVS